MPRVVAVESPTTLSRLHNLFESCLVDQSLELRRSAWWAIEAYSHRIKDDETIKSLSDIIPIAMKVRFKKKNVYLSHGDE